MEDDEEQEISSEAKSYFFMMPNMADDDLSTHEMRLYVHYCRVCGQGGKCFEKVKTTAEKLGISVGTVVNTRRALAERATPYIRLVTRKVRNLTRVDVVLCDLWPENVKRYAEDTVHAEERYRSRGETLAFTQRNASVHVEKRLKKNHVKEEPNEEKPKEEDSFVRSDLDIAQPTANEENERTNERTNESFSLLTDESILMGRNATIAKLAATYPFQDIRAFCCKFVDEGRTPGKDAGIIAYWLEAAETIPPTTHGEFYQRHRTPAEIADDAVREAEAVEENRRWEERRAQRIPPPVAPPPPAAVAVLEPAPTARPSRVEPAQVWQMALTDLALSMPAPTFETWLRDTDVLGYSDGEFVIGVPHAHARDWLTSRLKPQIKRTLSRLTQRSTEVSFAVRPRPNPNGENPCANGALAQQK